MRLGLLAAGTLVSLLLAVLALKLYERSVGADVPRAYVLEPRPGLWRKDAAIGFVNAPNVDRRAFGNVVGRTNGAGFRSKVELAREKGAATFRVVGMGDSVMWGIRVNEEDTFLGVLGELLRDSHADLEVVNAGVIGYSTYQERLLLEERVVAYEPDLVIVNFCGNDLLPTEDPFNSVREVYIRYLLRLREGKSPIDLTDEDRAALDYLVGMLRNAPNVWSTLRKSERHERSTIKLLIEIPMLEMKELANRHGFRLLYVFIPHTSPKKHRRELQQALQRFLDGIGVEYVDVFEDMVSREAGPPSEPSAKPRLARLYAWHARSSFKDVLDDLSLSWLDPVPSLRRIGQYRALRRRHAESNFIDALGHPSEKGNRIVAERLFEYLDG